MRIPISEITVNPGRRELDLDDVKELADSIRELGLLHPIIVDKKHTLIAGLHRLEAVKLLEWTEIECNVSSLEGLKAELAEIDENVIRSDLTTLEFGELLLKRKEIYETLHPETKAGISQANGMNRALGNNVECKMHTTSKPFVLDTAEKTGVNPSTIRRQVQTAKNLTPNAKKVIRESNMKIAKTTALKLSQLPPEEQAEAANMLAAGQVRSVEQYRAVKSVQQKALTLYRLADPERNSLNMKLLQRNQQRHRIRTCHQDFHTAFRISVSIVLRSLSPISRTPIRTAAVRQISFWLNTAALSTSSLRISSGMPHRSIQRCFLH